MARAGGHPGGDTVSRLERPIRTGGHTGVRADAILATALIGELVCPGPVMWLVSPWISDVKVLDNSQGTYDDLFDDNPPRVCSLSDLLARIVAAGASLTVVTRPDPHNARFIGRLRRLTSQRAVRVVQNPAVHEKTICGRDWLLTGSMNFTVRGLMENDEAVSYKVGGSDAAQARLELAQRWKEHQ
ncbi:phospholipase D-like domain-containing protein DpdK [Streptomyces pseudogriseolus]|uniref:phospholipase D-like domain-containing protein DpdK n=1 Tax=Streptomyces pseudogriseolus TaxID=36817 RepID=UPI0027E1BBE7|nr:phospholipase D-like domain-containing protein DpdK [Streptomyces pseudogriseolus]